MTKSIGGKIYSVLGVLSLVFIVMLILNFLAMKEIENNNNTVNAYMEMQAVKSEVSTAFQQVQLYSNLTYFKKDKEDERELMITKLGASLEVMDTQLTELGRLVEQLGDEEIGEVYSAWRSETDTFKIFIQAIEKDAKNGDYDAVFERVNVQNVNKAPVQTAEDNYDVLIDEKEATIIKKTEDRIVVADATNIVCLVIFGIIIVMAIFISTITIIKPAKNSGKILEGIVTKLKNGEGDLTERIPVKSKDEIGQMSIGINGFIEQLQIVMRKLKDESDNLMESAKKVREGLDNSSENATNVSATMEQMSASMEEIAATLDNIVVNNNEVASEIGSVEAQVNDGVELVGEIKIRADEMHRNTIESKETTSEILQEIREALKEAVEASRSVEKIQELTGDILDIASQTNLLSLNASIEAARAGEAGRGFAVVADEIRGLADSSRETASNIQSISELVTSAVEKLSMNAEKMVEFVDDKVMADYDGFVKVVNQYKQDAQSVNEILDSIYANTNTVSETMQVVNRGINDISTAVDESAKGVVDVAENVVDLVNDLEQIHAATGKNENISIQLGDEVKKFKNV